MTSLNKFRGGLAVFLFAAMCCLNAAAADKAADMAAIHAIDQNWLKAYMSQNADVIAGLYAEDSVLLPPGAPMVTGRAAIREYLVKDMAATAKAGMVFQIGSTPSGGVSGDMGWASGTYVIKDKAGKVVDTGKYLSVAVKKGGKWYYLRDTYNSDGPPAPAVAAPAASKH
jgi:uncharacterized protein (TIGR02246 family)